MEQRFLETIVVRAQRKSEQPGLREHDVVDQVAVALVAVKADVVEAEDRDR